MPLRNVVAISLCTIFSFVCYSVASKNRFANLFAEALQVVEQESLQEVPPRELFDNAMSGMLSGLDEHSMYISGDTFQFFDEDMKQKFGGVGMYVDNDPVDGRLVVLAPIPGTPAFEAGVKSGDWIKEISGVTTEGMERSDAIRLMRGPQGESVTVKMGREDREFEIVLMRAAIPVPSVHGDWREPDGTWKFFLKDHPEIAYLRLLQFGSISVEEMRAALEEVGPASQGLILDLRNNSGGLLDAAVEICDMFLGKEQLIVSTRGRQDKVIGEVFSAKEPIYDPAKPMVVLVNRNSASASEIVAACLQDHNRASIIGEQSWGKGTVQHVIPIERGKSALKLTTASYWRPNGTNINRFEDSAAESGVWGVVPEPRYIVELTEEEVFENARQRNRRDLQGLVRPVGDTSDPSDDGPAHVDRPLQEAVRMIDELSRKKRMGQNAGNFLPGRFGDED
ncbi:MAG: S41 family peptidase [Mariniblastus sp.]|nr:S41 family peptidase [Mariniblastus sp.]